MSKPRNAIAQTPALSARERFAEIVSRPDDQINLAEAALVIACEEYSHLDVNHYLEKIERLGDLARERAAGAEWPADIIAAINATLFDELGFSGNREHYYDPRNSFLNEVLDRRLGIPITLSVVYIEVARRIGFPVKGVGMPAHFIVKHEWEHGEIFIDPFNRGDLMGRAGCSELLKEMSGDKIRLLPEHLSAVTNKQILSRMLSNLLGIYGAGDHARAVTVIERILLIHPGAAPYVRDLGLLLATLGDFNRAVEELERYLVLAPGAKDVDAIREQIRTIRQTRARFN
jgi:regulator of sirC expression with transglutaminase-like and TPR domain